MELALKIRRLEIMAMLAGRDITEFLLSASITVNSELT